MTLITSISGIRGTIGGSSGEGLTPVDTVRFTSAYGGWLKKTTGESRPIVVLGRDARISGEMVEQLVTGALLGMGIDVVQLGMATTPTVELAVTHQKAHGGIILTASHNPAQWNALKLLNGKGEFLSASDGEQILERAQSGKFEYAEVLELGRLSHYSDMDQIHIDKVLELPLVDREKIRNAGFRVAVDAVNSVGGNIVPALLKQLGVEEVIELYCTPNGHFPHNPEPLPEHLSDLSELIVKEGADLGFVVDPDVDRLAIVCEDGSMFGEEYTLVVVSDYVLSRTPGNTCSNLSSSRALKEVTEKYGMNYAASAVGEVNVVEKMKETEAVIGGEGNGGVIYPELHYGRDALVGIGLFLTHLAQQAISCRELRNRYPHYAMVKDKIKLSAATDVKELMERVQAHFNNEQINTVDGLKIDFENGWVHLRRSNTEPIIRIYSEAVDQKEAEKLVEKVKEQLQ